MQDFCELCGRSVYVYCDCGLAQSLPRTASTRGVSVEALNKTFPAAETKALGAEVIANKRFSRARFRRAA